MTSKPPVNSDNGSSENAAIHHGAPVEEAPSLIEYPCVFPIKVMGAKVEGFVEALCSVATSFDATFDASTLELRPSSKGTYLGVTLSVRVTSREQLDELYRTLTTHPMVKIVL